MFVFLALSACSDSNTPEHAVEVRLDQGHKPEAGPGTIHSPGPDGIAPAPVEPTPRVEPPVGKQCNIDGKWTGTLPAGAQPWSGKPVTADFKSDGIFDATGPFGNRSATWEFTTEKVLVVSKSVTTGAVACNADQVGRYQGTFGDGCQTITFSKMVEQCAGRENGLADYTLTRAP